MKNLTLSLSLCLLYSCGFGEKNEHNLSEEDLKFINEIIPLEDDEEIQLFETNGGLKGLKTSGNFITNKRLASYWINGKTDEVHSIKYSQIDSLKTMDRTNEVTYASWIQIYCSSQNNFKIYVDADSTRTWTFFKEAVGNWNSKK